MAVAPRCRNGKASSYYRGCWCCLQSASLRLAAGFISHVSLVEILIPFCVMAIANGAIYPIVVARALRPFPHATGRAAALQNTLQLGLCFLASLVVSWLISISTPLLTTTSVMLSTVVLVALGYMMQRCEEVGCQNHGNAEVAHSESH